MGETYSWKKPEAKNLVTLYSTFKVTISGFPYLFREYCFDIDIRRKSKLQFRSFSLKMNLPQKSQSGSSARCRLKWKFGALLFKF